MSVKQMSLVWEHEFDHAEQSIMLALADHAHDDGTEIRPGVGRLAWKTGYSDRQVKRILKKLRDETKILKLTRQGDGRGHPNVYCFDWTKGVKKSPFRPVKGDNMTPFVEEKGDISNVKGDKSGEKGDIAVSPEPSIEPSIEPKEVGAEAKGGEPTLPDDVTTRCLRVLLEVKNFPRDQAKNAMALADYRNDFPSADALAVCKDFRAYITETGKPPTRLRLRNFFRMADKWAAENGSRSSAKAEKPKRELSPKEQEEHERALQEYDQMMQARAEEEGKKRAEAEKEWGWVNDLTPEQRKEEMNKLFRKEQQKIARGE